MPNERYIYRGLRTDLGKILSIWPFENSTTVIEKLINAKMFLLLPLHNKIFILDVSDQVLEDSGQELGILKSS